MIFQPIIPAFVLIAAALVATVTGIVFVFKKKSFSSDKFKWILRTGTVLLTLLLLARPGVFSLQDQQTYTNEFDIYFVVDVTSSMVAEDWEENSDVTRLDAVKQDVKQLIDDYPDARYGLISSDTESSIVTPLTRDSTALVTGLDYLKPEITRNSNGSNPAQFLNLLSSTLASNSENNADRATLVFVFTDGEITNDTVEIKSDPNIGSYISAGGVLGYGTDTGGKMKVQQGYYISNDKGYIQDPATGKEAISKIDEKNLQKIADILNVPYTHRTPADIYTPPGIDGGLKISDVKSVRIITDYSWVVAIGLLGLLTIDTGLLVNKYRKEKTMLNKGGE